MRATFMAVCLLIASSAVLADNIYRWKGADGRIYYGDVPPTEASNIEKIDRRTAGQTAPSNQSQLAASTEPLDARDAECARKREQLATYRKASRLVEKDSLGREREFSAEETALLIGRTEVEINVLCGGLEQ